MTLTMPYWPVQIKGKVTVCVPPSVQKMTSYVLLEQEDWFEDEMDFVRGYITPEMNVLDIGANHGVYALSIAQRLAGGRIWAFEPTTEPGQMLEKSIGLNGFADRITLIPAGLSDRTGTAEIHTSANSELNSLHGTSQAQETIRLETLDGFLQTQGVALPFSFVKLDAEGEEIRVLQGGQHFFQQQSPLILFELKHGGVVNQGLAETLEKWGYGIFRLLPDLQVLVGYDPSDQEDVLNLFAAKPDRAASLAGRGLLAMEEDVVRFDQQGLAGLADWSQTIRGFPYAQACEREWAAHQGEVPAAYLSALSAVLQVHAPTLPSAQHVSLLRTAGALVDQMLAVSPAAHFSVWLLKAHLLHLQNRRAAAVQLCRQLLASFSQAPTPAWPFVPPCGLFFTSSPRTAVGPWLHNVLREFIELRQSFSSYFQADPLPGLQPILLSPDHDLAMERRFILGALKAGKAVRHPPSLALLDPARSANSQTWHQLLGYGFSCVLLSRETPVHVVDVGASSHGRLTEPYAPLMQLGLAWVTGFEPNEEECRRLNALYAAEGTYHYLPSFVGNGEPATFHETNWFMTSSLYKPNDRVSNTFEQLDSVVRLKETHPVQTVSLNHLEGLGEIDLIKIDIQGGELDVFKGAAEKLDEVLAIWTEVEFIPLYENQPLFAEVDQYLRGRGFRFHAFEGIATRAYKPFAQVTNRRDGCRQAVWTDAIFLRDPDLWPTLSTLKLKKMAAILDAVVKSQDLCYLALRLIDTREGSDLSSRYLAATGSGAQP